MLMISDIKNAYNIKEIADRCGESEQTIRNWEKKIIALKPKRNTSNHRIFSTRDLRMIKNIAFLFRENQLSINAINNHIKKIGIERFLKYNANTDIEPIIQSQTQMSGMLDVNDSDIAIMRRKLRTIHYTQLSNVKAELLKIKEALEDNLK